MTRWNAAAVVLALAAPCLAQDAPEAPPPAREQLVRVFAEAKASGALERLLQPVAFRVEQGGNTLIVRRRGALEDDGARLVCRVDVAMVGGPSQGVELQVTSAFDLETARLSRSEFVTLLPAEGGRRRGVARGTLTVGGDQLAVIVEEPDGSTQEVEVPWGDDVIPWSLLFFLASLQDQGMPDALTVRIYDETRLQLGVTTQVVCARAEDDDMIDVLTCEVRPLADAGKPFQARVVAEGPGAGSIKAARLRKWRALVPLPDAEARRLLKEAGLEVDPGN